MRKHLFTNGNDKCPKCGGKLGIKLSKFGPFVGCENYPKCDYTIRLNSNNDNSTEQNKNEPKDLGEGISFKIGKFGPYVTDGTKNASAKKYNSETITLEIARELLSGEKKKVEPIEIGKNPETNKMIYFYPTGRYGAYISSNKVNVSVTEQPDLETAIDLINNKKTTKRFSKK
jgi:DNA topoisomerase-1